jgi:hypothetical protein
MFYSYSWYEIYDFLEFLVRYIKSDELRLRLNSVLETELAPFKIIDSYVTEITDKQESDLLEDVLRDNDYPGVKLHLLSALENLSRREKPDYRNSIKESISAVESLAKFITNNEHATLSDALRKLDSKIKIHGALKEGFEKLYSYTSDADGIRHGMMD